MSLQYFRIRQRFDIIRLNAGFNVDYITRYYPNVFQLSSSITWRIEISRIQADAQIIAEEIKNRKIADKLIKQN